MADYKDIITGTIAELVNKAKEVAESPSVRSAVDKVKAAAESGMDKVKDVAETGSIKEVYDQGAQRVKGYGRMAKLSLEMNGDLEELKRVYSEIGRLCYQQYKDSPEGFFAPLFAQAEEINSRIDQRQAEIDALKAQAAPSEEPDISVEIVADAVEDTVEEAVEDFQQAAEDFREVLEDTEEQGSGQQD